MDLVEILKGLWQNISANLGFTAVIGTLMTWVIGSGACKWVKEGEQPYKVTADCDEQKLGL